MIDQGTAPPQYEENAAYMDEDATTLADEMREQVEQEKDEFVKPPGKGKCSIPPTFNISDFSLNGTSKNMESQMLEDKYVLEKLAILGQSTVFYAKPNAGKTLLIIWLICDAIRRMWISGGNIFYVNADDNHTGLVHKLQIAERYGFHMLAPGYNNFKATLLPSYLESMIKTDSAMGRVLVLDTVKKFTNLMNKDTGSKFGESVRQFVAHGGTIISLAHVNKHRDDDNKVVFAGTSDLVDDADCAYTLDIVTEDKNSGQRTVMFENFKSRGNVAKEAVYRYDYADGTSYLDRLESVVEVGETELRQTKKQLGLSKKLEKNMIAISVIKDCLKEGINQKTALIREASEQSGISKPKITKVLNEHTGACLAENKFWHVVVGDKNAHAYNLNYSVL